jgi:hypothetical protein
MSWTTGQGHRIDFVPEHPHHPEGGLLLKVTGSDGTHIGYFASVFDLGRTIDLSGLREIEDDP